MKRKLEVFDELSDEAVRKVARKCATDNKGEHVICLDDKDDEEAVRLVIESKAQASAGGEKPRTLEELANSTRDFTEEDYETLLKLDEDKKAPSLTADEIAALPHKYLNKCDILAMNKKGANNTCCICCSAFVNGDYVRILPGCGHVFHAFCIEPWLSKSVFCPVDRMDVHEELNKPAKKEEKTEEKKIEVIEID